MTWVAAEKAVSKQDWVESHGVGLKFRKELRSEKKREEVDAGKQGIRFETINLKSSREQVP